METTGQERSPRRPADLAGRELGEWVVGEAIGRGGFADVYLARQPRLERDAVIKVLRVDGAHQPRRVQAFKREARLACQLDHPYAAHVYSFGESDGLLWIAMELVRGKSLHDMLSDGGAIELARFVALFERLCEVVHTAHEVGLIHRDIKPANVMVVTRAGRLLPKLLDFGISEASGERGEEPAARPRRRKRPSVDELWDELIDTEPDATATAEDTWNRPAGTPAYMSPEQWSGAAIDHRADIYALGILAFECLTGRLPYRATTAREYFILHSQKPVPELPARFGAELRAALARAMAKSPDDRYATALELAAAVRRAAAPDSTPALTRTEATPWLLAGPPQLGDSLAAFEAADPDEAAEALRVFLSALARWVGVVSLAASGSRGSRVLPEAAALWRWPSIEDWLEIAEAVCRPFLARPEDFPIPELVYWLEDRGRQRFVALADLTRDQSEVSAAAIELLSAVLRSLQFLCNYGLTFDESPGGDAATLADGDGNPLLSLAPLVSRRSYAPGSPLEIFVAAGARAGHEHTTLIADPQGFEIETESIAPWLEERFGLANAPRVAPADSERPPYRGLAPFTAEDAGAFFGRNRDVQALYNRALGQPFIALTGPSGSGKSSLISAGLIPRLAPDEWSVVRMRPAMAPVRSLETALAGLPPGGGDTGAILEWLDGERRRLIVVVDQAEELLTLATADEAARFVDMLIELLAHPRVRVLISIRDDFIGQASEISAWSQHLAGGLSLIGAPSREELAAMVRGPAQRVGYDFDDETLVDDMVDEVAGRTGALPLLSFAASRLWSDRDRERRLLTRASYQQMGGVAGALAGYAEEVLEVLPTRRQAIVRRLFRHLVTGRGTRAVVSRADLELSPAESRVLEHLITSRLLVAAEGEDGAEYISIIHETLLSRWPRLQRWRDEDAAGLRFRDELRSAASSWTEHERDPSYLWRGAALRNLEGWREQWSDQLSATEQSFVAASVRLAHRSRRTRRMIIAAMVALLSVTVVVLVLQKRSVTARQKRAEAEVTDMLARRGYSELLAGRRLRALAYLEGAYARGRASRGSRLALAIAVRAIEARRASERPSRGLLTLSAANPGRDEFTTEATGEPTRLWRWSDGQLRQVATFDHGGKHTTALSPDGEHVATVGDTGVKIWRRDGTLQSEGEASAQSKTVQFSAGADRLISAYSDANTIAMWGLDGERRLLVAPAVAEAPFAVAQSPDGARLATIGALGTLRIWDLETSEPIAELALGVRPTGLSFSPDGRRLYAGLTSGELVSLEPGPAIDPESVTRRKLYEQALRFQLYPDGSRVLTEGARATIRILDAGTLDEIASLPGASRGAVIDPTSTLIATLDGSQVLIWDAIRGGRVSSLDVGAVVTSAVFSADGETLFATTTDGQLSAWDTGRRDAERIIRGEPGKVFGAARSPDGATLARLTDKAIELYDSGGGLRQTIGLMSYRAPYGMPHIEYSADGSMLFAPDNLAISTFDAATGLRLAQLSGGEIAAAGSPGPRGLVATTGEIPNKGFVIDVWDLATETVVAERTTELLAQDVELTPGGDAVLWCSHSAFGLWRFTAGADAWETRGVNCEDIDLSPDGRLAVANRRDGIIEVRDAATGAVYRTLRPPIPGTDAVGFNRDASLLAAASADRRIYIWDVEAGVAVVALDGHSEQLRSVEFAADDTVVSVDLGGDVFVWKLGFETRSPAELDRLVGDRLPFRLSGIDLVRVEQGASP